MTWWPSSMTFLCVNVTYWNCSPIPYVDQVWWWYVKAFMSYAWQNWQTDRQTNRQTNILAKNCKFWQVTNRQTNILAKNCKFWQVINYDGERDLNLRCILVGHSLGRIGILVTNSDLICINEFPRWYRELYEIDQLICSKLATAVGPLMNMLTWLILGLRPANERRRYFVTTSLIGWAQT